jgi:hypothetical protein
MLLNEVAFFAYAMKLRYSVSWQGLHASEPTYTGTLFFDPDETCAATEESRKDTHTATEKQKSMNTCGEAFLMHILSFIA